MRKPVTQKIVIIGCGNVAWHLAKQLQSLGGFSVVVYNHRANSSMSDFKSKLGCKTVVGLDKIDKDAAIYFICVSDKFIASVSKKIHCEKTQTLILHTSGAAKISEIKNAHPNTGVFYPLQTFSKADTLNWREIPILLEGSSAFAIKKLKDLGKIFSSTIVFLDYKQRLRFHLSAVIVNNFTNALYVSASSMVGEEFKLLMPLIRQTTAKLGKLEPLQAQTGPAKRKVTGVMKKHIALIPKQSGLKKIYKELSKLILKQQSDA